MDIQTIQRAIDALPRHRLTYLPTPLQHCPRLSAALEGPQIWIKRDDLTGLAFGGNKSRYLEFTLAEGTAQGCDAAVTERSRPVQSLPPIRRSLCPDSASRASSSCARTIPSWVASRQSKATTF